MADKLHSGEDYPKDGKRKKTMQYVNKEKGLIIPMVAKVEWWAKVEKEAKITISESPDLFMKPNQIKVHWKTGIKFIKKVSSLTGEVFIAEEHTYDAFSNSENFFDSVVFTERKKQDALRHAIKTINKAFYTRNNAEKAIGEMENSWDDDSEPEAITSLKANLKKAVNYITTTSGRIYDLAKQYSSEGEEITISQLREEFWDTAVEKFYLNLFNQDVYEEVPGIVEETDTVIQAKPQDFSLTEKEVEVLAGDDDDEDLYKAVEEEDSEFGPVEQSEEVMDPEEEVEEMEVKLTPSEAEEALGDL